MKKILIIIGALFAIAAGVLLILIYPHLSKAPTNTTDSEPSVTVSPATLSDTIEVASPLPGAAVASPLVISGRARGSWFFEASAPVELKDASGVVIAHGTLQATSDWMTADFVPFTGTLTFSAPSTSTGTLVLKNDNPSGDPAKEKRLEIPVRF
jgi:hypothetical protein